MRQLAVLSGKGGTGKTTISAALIRLAQCHSFADCDVDAPNLHLIHGFENAPEEMDYYGYDKAFKDDALCIECGKCEVLCRFGAINKGIVDPYACEGCGVCEAFCPMEDSTGQKAIRLKKSSTGKTSVYKNTSEVFSTAELKMGSGASGKLVSQVRKNLYQHISRDPLVIIDGSPGIGCPVIASVTGVNWVLIVSEPTVSGIHDMKRIVAAAQHFGVKPWLCVNKYDVSLDHTEQITKYCVDNGIEMIGRIPFDKVAVEAANRGVSVVEMPDSTVGKSITLMWDTLKELMALDS